MTAGIALDERQATAIAYDATESLAIVGGPGSGKTTALVARAERPMRASRARRSATSRSH
jgi:superfamily I DNA/RNA helicase